LAEVPEYLLQRSRERRAALGAGGEGGGPTPSGGDTPPSEAPPSAAPATVEAAEAPVEVAAAVPAVIEEAPPAPVLPQSRTGIPGWMIPVLVALPFWAIVYMGAFGTAKSSAKITPAQLGAKVFTTNCAPCHGARGEGGVGPKLAGGEAALTFPDAADHIAWVETGSGPHKGQPYGDPNRPGGQHVAKSGGMPAFKGQLKDDQITAVVTYERTGLQ
jgi:mono/diheme cytochrome c family protein